MRKTKIFKCGNSMAIRIPKDCQLHGDEVEIIKHDGEIIIREIPQNICKAITLLQSLPNDFFEHSRQELPPQKRELL
jgi:antitoxin VapB